MQEEQTAHHKKDRHTPGDREDDEKTLRSMKMHKHREYPYDTQYTGAENRKNRGQCGMPRAP